MQNNDSNILAAEQNESHMPLDAVERALQRRLRDNIAPLGLEIDCPKLLAWAQQWHEPGFRYQNLVRELRIWSGYLRRRPLARTFFNDPFRLMDAPGLTELVYAVGQTLRLLHGHHVEHCVKLTCADLTHQNLGLLKGLEFNHICLAVDADLDLQELQVHRQMLEDFKFKYFSLELACDYDKGDFLLHLMELLSYIEPASVRLAGSGAAPFADSDRDGLGKLLMQFGYFLGDHDNLLKVSTPLHKRPSDTLRLGPGERSRFATTHASNFAAPMQYGERLDRNLLPIATCF